MNDELRRRAELLLQTDIAAALELDGRELEVVAVENGIASVRLGSVCTSCPAGIPLLIQQIEAELKARMPEIEILEAVA